MSRRALLGIGASIPIVLGLSACGLKPKSNLSPAPLIQLVVQQSASVFGTRAGVQATDSLTEGMNAARDQLRAIAGEDLNSVWAADLDGHGKDILIAGYWGDGDHLQANALQTSSGRVLPATVQLGLSLHGANIRSIRQQTNWSGWRKLSDSAIREWIRDELEISAFNRRGKATDDILTEARTYLCLLQGRNDLNNNPSIQIEWHPTTVGAELSSIVVKRGRALAGDETWVPDYNLTVPFRFPELWQNSNAPASSAAS